MAEPVFPVETFKGGDLLEKRARKGDRLYRFLVEGCSLEGARLREARFLEGTFRAVAFFHGDVTAAYLPRAHFEQCTFQGTRFASAYFRGAEFSGCKIRDCDFNNACLAEVKFTDCEIQQCDFSLAEFSESRFQGVKLRSNKFFLADFSNTVPETLAGLQAELKGALLPVGYA